MQPRRIPERTIGGRLIRVAGACVLAGALAGSSGRLASVHQTPPDIVLHNGHVIVVDGRASRAEAIAIQGERITAVGTDASVFDLLGPRTVRIDLRGRTVVPGFADDHLHSAGGGPGVDLSTARRMSEVLQAIAERARREGPDRLVVTNGDWHEAQLEEQRLPLRRDLDEAAPLNPVVVVRGGHEYILNSAALRRWSIDERTTEPEGGQISTYPDGALNGELVDAAKALVTLPPPPARSLEERIADQQAQYETLHAVGLTSVRHPGVSIDQYRLLQEMQRRGLLTMRLNVLLRPDRGADAAAVGSMIADWGVEPDEGDAMLRLGGVKLGVDGGFEGGWMREAYAEPFGREGTFRGLQTMAADRYTAIVKALNRLGWRVATHAVGDAAIDQVLDAYEGASNDRSIVGRRWVIEHGFIPRADHFARMKRLGLVISAQAHLYLAGPSLVRYWGPERAAWTTPVRAYLDAGLVVAAGTDSPVVPYSPLWTIYHFVSRDTISGGVLGEDQRVSREEALRLSTLNNAYLTGEEEDKGSIEPGKWADLVVLSDDILTGPESRIEQTTVLLTMVGGRIVFEHPRFADAPAGSLRR